MSGHEFKAGQMVVAKRTVWSSSYAEDHVPRLLIAEGKQYEVIHVNQIGRHCISIRDENGESSWDLDPHISEWAEDRDSDKYEFPFYTIQEWREKTLGEIGID
jgi:hypothetical protein